MILYLTFYSFPLYNCKEKEIRIKQWSVFLVFKYKIVVRNFEFLYLLTLDRYEGIEIHLGGVGTVGSRLSDFFFIV